MALVLRKSILAGIIVTIAAYNYALNYDILSKILFPVALIIILLMNLNLYTSKIGNLCCNNEIILSDKLKNIATILFGNIVTCVIFAYMFSFVDDTHALEIWTLKLQTPMLIWFFKATVVGILLQVAVFSRNSLVTIGVVLLFLSTNTEHSIANVVYMSLARAFSFKSLLYIFVCILGNTVGACIVYKLNKDNF